jgi:hypothetical protein
MKGLENNTMKMFQKLEVLWVRSFLNIEMAGPNLEPVLKACDTIGYLVGETEAVICLAQSKSGTEYSNVIVIDRRAITSYNILRKDH